MRYTTTPLWEQFNAERDKLQAQLSERLRQKMTTLMNNTESGVDITLVAADGHRFNAHICILRQRAPVFFARYIEPVLEAAVSTTPRPTGSGRGVQPTETIGCKMISIGEVDAAGLEFFLRSVYTDEELVEMPIFVEKRDDEEDDEDEGADNTKNRNSSRNVPRGEERRQSNQMNRSAQLNASEKRNMRGSGKVIKESPDSLNGEEKVFYSNEEEDKMSNSFHSFHQIDCSAHSFRCTETPTVLVPLSQQHRPLMTSFRELASSCESKLNQQKSKLSKDFSNEQIAADDFSLRKFNRIDDSGNGSAPGSPAVRVHSRSIFPIWIGSGEADDTISETIPLGSTTMDSSLEGGMSQSFPRNSAPSPSIFTSSIRSRTLNARRLSVASLSSLTSIDSTTLGQDGPIPTADRNPASRLAFDLLQMFTNGRDTDISIVTEDKSHIWAHRCILYASCEYFRKQLLKKSVTSIDMKRYSREIIQFLMEFIYGGITCLPEHLDVWEVVELGKELKLDDLFQVAYLHLKTYKCHFFHRPCASCVSAIFDALPQFANDPQLVNLYEDSLAWQARHFARIWKGRVFFHLNERWQNVCFEALLQAINEENVIDVMLGCEKLQVSLIRFKTQTQAQTVLRLVLNVVEYCMDFLVAAFDLVIASQAFRDLGKGLALNLSTLEDIFPPLIHRLNADTGIKTLINLKDLLVFFINENKHCAMESPSKRFETEWNARFLNLCRRLHESTDKHLLHHAASVVKSASYSLLNTEEQLRVRDAGIFVEMQKPMAPPPKLSSFSRTTAKRSASAGVPQYGNMERTRSLERPSHFDNSLIEVSTVDKHRMEAIMEREKSQNQIVRGTSGKKEMSKNEEIMEVLNNSINRTTTETENKKTLNKSSKIPAVSNKTRQNSPAFVPRLDSKNSSEMIRSQDSDQMGHSASTSETVLTMIPTTINKTSSVTRPSNNRRNSLKMAVNNATNSVVNTIRKAATKQPQKRQKSPFKKKYVESEGLIRQNTHTLMTVQQNLEAGIIPVEMASNYDIVVPTSDTTSAAVLLKNTKPQSIVRPMPKPISAASTIVVTQSPPLTTKPLSSRSTESSIAKKNTAAETIKNKRVISSIAPSHHIEERGRRRHKNLSPTPPLRTQKT